MAKEMKRFIQENTLKLSDDEIRQLHKEKIGILYGFNNYRNDLEHINELRKHILQDYPDAQDKDIEVWYIRNTQSIRHASFTMLYIMIPTDDFLKLRAEEQIHIL